MKLWILDADVIIDLLELDKFNTLVEACDIYLATTVINEVQYFHRSGKDIPVDLRREYVDKNLIVELLASVEDLQEAHKLIPPCYRLHDGELESLAVLLSRDDLTFCTFDAAAIRVLPFLELSDRAICLEELLKQAGISRHGLKPTHKKSYLESNLREGKTQKIYRF